jgi:phospholipase A2
MWLANPPGTLERKDFQWSKVWTRAQIQEGLEPFPILTAIRHERPWKDWKDPTEPFELEHAHTIGASQVIEPDQDAAGAWWQWFEFNPLEVGSDELEGWIPTWSFGRK